MFCFFFDLCHVGWRHRAFLLGKLLCFFRSKAPMTQSWVPGWRHFYCVRGWNQWSPPMLYCCKYLPIVDLHFVEMEPKLHLLRGGGWVGSIGSELSLGVFGDVFMKDNILEHSPEVEESCKWLVMTPLAISVQVSNHCYEDSPWHFYSHALRGERWMVLYLLACTLVAKTRYGGREEGLGWRPSRFKIIYETTFIWSTASKYHFPRRKSNAWEDRPERRGSHGVCWQKSGRRKTLSSESRAPIIIFSSNTQVFS
jgi:hypothetical protein